MTPAGTRARRFRKIAPLAALCVLVAVPSAAGAPLTVTKSKVVRGAEPIAEAAGKKGKKRKAKATTRSAEVPFGSGATVSETERCPGKSHLTGGGFAASPPLTAGSGIASTSVVSLPVTKKHWTADSAAFAAPAASGIFTTFARCEPNALGKTIRLSISGTVNPGSVVSALLDCPGRSHALGGGYQGTPPASLSGGATSLRTFILESRRRTANQWAVTAYTSFTSPVAAPFTAYVICEGDGKGRKVSEGAALTQIADNGRTTGDPRCEGKRHVVSGGYVIEDSDATLAVAAFLDESHPVGKKGWHVGMWEHPALNLPPGATLQSFAYCKRTPGKKGRK